MNYLNCIIQILELPSIKLDNNNVPMIKFRAHLPYIRNKTQSPIIIESIIWGDLTYDLVNYYQVNDYILVEGYLSIFSDNIINEIGLKLRIIRLYPFLFAVGAEN